jgi:hypothetical protein
VRKRAPTAVSGLALLALCTGATGLLAGCGAKSTPAVFANPSQTASAGPRAAPSAVPSAAAALPLTGLPATRSQSLVPVVAAALSGANVTDSGAAKAETVFVEFSDSVRMLALFQSVAAAQLGPISQTRPADGPILGVTNAIFANAGGPKGFVSILDATAVNDSSNTRAPGAYQASGAGLFTTTDSLRRTVTGAKSAPPLFTFATAGESLAQAAKPARQLTVTMAGRTAITWTYDVKAKAWTTPDPALAGARPHSLIVQEVAYKLVQLKHPDGAYVPSARVYGNGAATVLSGASTVSGRWLKPGAAAVTVFSDANGVPVHLAPGITWVLLVPTGTAVTVS